MQFALKAIVVLIVDGVVLPMHIVKHLVPFNVMVFHHLQVLHLQLHQVVHLVVMADVVYNLEIPHVELGIVVLHMVGVVLRLIIVVSQNVHINAQVQQMLLQIVRNWSN
jgi:hypothetical protein